MALAVVLVAVIAAAMSAGGSEPDFFAAGDCEELADETAVAVRWMVDQYGDVAFENDPQVQLADEQFDEFTDQMRLQADFLGCTGPLSPEWMVCSRLGDIQAEGPVAQSALAQLRSECR